MPSKPFVFLVLTRKLASSVVGAAPLRARSRIFVTTGSAARILGPAISPLAPSDFSETDRKSTRLNSSHTVISYAVFCLKKKRNKHHNTGAVFALVSAIEVDS